MIPKGNNTLLKCSYDAKKILCLIGLDCVKILACLNDYILYRKEYENLKEFPRCRESRYKLKDNDDVTKKGVIVKVMWYLPIIQRFKRLFADVNHAKNTRWNTNERICDGNILHVVDSLQWNKISLLFLNFALESRKLRLELATNRINLIGNMSINHASWLILLIIYNLSLGCA